MFKVRHKRLRQGGIFLSIPLAGKASATNKKQLEEDFATNQVHINWATGH